MAISYRTDWQEPDQDSPSISVAYHDQDLAAARATARRMSRRHGSAYVIARDDDARRDLGQITYYDGVALSRSFEA